LSRLASQPPLSKLTARPQFQEHTSLNSTLDGIIEFAKRTLHVPLLGDALPAASHLQDLIAAWGVSAAREAAWDKCRIALALAPNPAA